MATPPTDATRELFKLIGDGEWHSYVEVREALAAKIPPGPALRKYESRAAQNKQYRNAELDQERSEDEKIHYGKLAVAQVTISSWKGRGLMHRVGENGKEIRVKPGFEVWGLKLDPERQDPGKSSEGYTDLPSGDSEPSERDPRAAEEVSGPDQDPAGESAAPDPPVVEAPAAADGGPAESDEPAFFESSPSVVIAGVRSCGICGREMRDFQQHMRVFHPVFSSAGQIAAESVDEVTLRTLIRAELASQLDLFQQGMQVWLTAQFMQLEASLRACHTPAQRWAAGDIQSAQR